MSKSACKVINFQAKRRKIIARRKRQDKAISASQVITGAVGAVADIKPDGLIFIALKGDEVSYGLHGTAEAYCTSTKSLAKVLADLL